MAPRATRFGSPQPRMASEATVIIVEPAGLMANRAPTALGNSSPDVRQAVTNQGQTVYSQNFIVRDGGIEPRPKISSHTLSQNPLGTLVTGGTDVQSSLGTHYNLVSGTTRFAWYSNASYSPLSYVSSAGRSTPPSMTTADRVDFCQIYEPTNDEMLAIASATSSYQTLFCWKSGTTIISTLTQAPRARWVAAFDNFVLAANIRDVASAQSKYVQRVQWCDRGNPFNWTTGLSGFQDILDAKGQVQRIIVQESRAVVFFDDEIWVGVRDAFPNTMRFSPLDHNIGTPYGMTCADTPRGVAFLGADYMIYLLPKEGGPAVPVGQAVQRHLRETDIRTERRNSWAVYDEATTSYQLFYTNWASQNPIGTPATDIPQDAVYLNINDGSCTLHSWRADSSYARSLSAGWTGQVSFPTTGPTWNSSTISGAYTWATYPLTPWTAAMDSTLPGALRTTFMGSSDGTVYYQSGDFQNDDGSSVLATWHSPALFGETPERSKCVTGLRVDYQADQPSTISVQVRLQGANSEYRNISTIALAQTKGIVPQKSAVAWMHEHSQYPTFVVSSPGHGFRLHRFWVSARLGGRP